MIYSLKNGTVLDPAQTLHAPRDVAVQEGKIAALLEPDTEAKANKVVDAQGLLVTPGLIDTHVHIFFQLLSLWGRCGSRLSGQRG